MPSSTDGRPDRMQRGRPTEFIQCPLAGIQTDPERERIDRGGALFGRDICYIWNVRAGKHRKILGVAFRSARLRDPRRMRGAHFSSGARVGGRTLRGADLGESPFV